jgi:hypothetical protein
MRQERGLGAKSHETKHDGTIWGAPCKTVVEGDGGMWCSCAVEVGVGVGLCIGKCKAQPMDFTWSSDIMGLSIVDPGTALFIGPLPF